MFLLFLFALGLALFLKNGLASSLTVVLDLGTAVWEMGGKDVKVADVPWVFG